MGNKNSQVSVIGGEEYERLRVLGKGSFGKVYAMRHVSSDVIRVVKEMNKADIVEKGKSTVASTSAERKIFSHLKGCPYVCKAYAATQDSTNLYMLLEFCPGGELEFHRVQKEFFDEEDVKTYLAMLSYGLGQMHKKYHVVHRDIKPENILLTEKGYLRFIDLNIAEICSDAECTVANERKSTIGTMPYIAPELLKGEPHDRKVDWWSLGVLIFFLATGRLPFVAKDEEGKKKKQLQLDAITGTTVKKQFSRSKKAWEDAPRKPKHSEDFMNLVSQLLEMDPKKRLDEEGIKNHKFFDGFDWKPIETQSLSKVPIIPRDDRVNFGNDANVEDIFGMEKHSKHVLSPEEQANFKEWDWVAEDQELPKTDLTNSTKGKKNHATKPKK